MKACEPEGGKVFDRGSITILRVRSFALTTGRYTYDRYVRNTGQCFSTGEIAVIARIAAADNPACRVYRCEAIDPEDRPFRVPIR